MMMGITMMMILYNRHLFKETDEGNNDGDDDNDVGDKTNSQVCKKGGWLTVWLVAIDVIHYKVNNNIARQHLVSQPAAATAPTVVDENKIF